MQAAGIGEEGAGSEGESCIGFWLGNMVILLYVCDWK